jgi:hypothetical protein
MQMSGCLIFMSSTLHISMELQKKKVHLNIAWLLITYTIPMCLNTTERPAFFKSHTHYGKCDV